MKFLRRSLIGLFLLVLTLGLLAAGGQVVLSALQDKWAEKSRQRPHRERVFSVQVKTAEPTSLVPQITTFGEIRSQRTLDIRAAAAGTIVALDPAFVEGGAVQAGSLLARIDPQTAQAALERAKGDLTEAKAELSESKRALTLARDEVAAAKAQADLRTQALLRQEDLKARGVGTDTAIEAAALAAAAANQAVLSRRQALQTAEARLTRAETRLIRQQINLSEAERNLADTSIYAGFSGTLSAVSAVQGGLVARNERLAQLVDATALEVSFRVSTRQYARLLGPDATLQPARVKVTMDLFGVDMVAQGNLSRESAVVGAGKTGRLLFARLDSASGFKPGDFVTVQIDEPRLEGVVLLPASAVDANQSVLLVGPEQRLRAQKVELLRTQGNDVIVSAAGVAGQQVVQMRSPLLGAGIKVKVQDAQNGAPAGPEMVSLTPERREELRAFVKANTKMPQAAKQRLLDQLEREKIPARMLRRLQSRMER